MVGFGKAAALGEEVGHKELFLIYSLRIQIGIIVGRPCKAELRRVFIFVLDDS